MEASITTAKGTGGEVRHLHIIYFLSHMGRIEHPHLIRVHHLNRNGVYLRDVKRWMTDLRGKDMPDAFAWSYKRYKNDYVWQDLTDDDLITPISDNEYVLKGSEVFPTSRFDANANGENKVSVIKNGKLVGVDAASSQTSLNPIIDTPTKASPEIYEESPIFSSDCSTITEDSTKQEQGPSKFNPLEENMDKCGSLPSSYVNSNLLGQKKKKKKRYGSNNNNDDDGNDSRKSSCSIEKMGTRSSSFSLSSPSPSLESQFAKSKRYSTGASKMLRNLITCGAVDTNDTAVVAANKYSSNKSVKKGDEICKGEILGGSSRGFGTPWNHQDQQYNARRTNFDGPKQQQSGIGKPKGVPPAYKPVGTPTCSQCGKSFKPEKLHTHMKSCKGMKASGKPAAASFKRNPPPPSMTKLMTIS
ncbi:protein SOSEKI 1 isoform X2 [Ricinus communis]|uniref:protein SOSEKI 1 isoform X2 n=1 Tax=Ricinus communis TaxID=3988 RepID=UPI00201B1A82|nr:protein SOSEKI 1 isoform X2 [Ricinus communis]